MKYEIKKIYLDDNLEIVDGNREYFIYFERVGHRFSKIEELVLPAETERFLEFIKDENEQKRYEVFHFRKYTDEYRLNRTSVGHEIHNGKKLVCLNVIDIEDSFEFFDAAVIEEEKQRLALSIMEDSFFSYQKDTNKFTMIHYHDGKCYVDFNLDIDIWKKQMLDEKYVPEDQTLLFDKMISDIKACLSKIYINITCGFKTSGKIMQSLDFFGSRFVDPSGKISIVGRIIANTKNQSTQETNHLLAELQFDSLTKCYNKKTILEYAQKRLKEYDEGERIGFVFVDLDNFKPVNDAYGHLAGDRILEQTGEVLRSIVGDKGHVGRYGGDEFLLILNHVDNEEVLRGTLQAILNNVRAKFSNSFDDIKVTPSIGASVFPDDGTTFDELFKKADFCLYRAKDKGRDRYIFFREDLHLELYKKAVESTSGVKYQGREIQELKYMAEFMRNLGESPYTAITNVMNHMLEVYNLGDITIYYGNEMKRVYSVGQERDEQKEALYVHEKAFKKALNELNVVRVDFPEDIGPESNVFRKTLEKRGIKSTIQCILGTKDNIKGLITFDKLKEFQQWAEYEVNCAVMFSSSFNLLPESTKVDFMLYNKI